MDPIFQIGKNSLTPENTAAIEEALEAYGFRRLRRKRRSKSFRP